jgi:hypothetical protein
MTLKSLDAPTALGGLLGNSPWSSQLPHLDGLVQASADEIATVWRKRNAINAILVSIGALESFNQITPNIPDPDALVKGTRGNVLGIRGNGNSRHAVLNSEGGNDAACLDIPEPDGTIPTSRGNSTSVTREVQGVDILLMAREGVANSSRGNVPDLLMVSRTPRE